MSAPTNLQAWRIAACWSLVPTFALALLLLTIVEAAAEALDDAEALA